MSVYSFFQRNSDLDLDGGGGSAGGGGGGGGSGGGSGGGGSSTPDPSTPAQYTDSGDGSEATPYSSSVDNTAGIQTVVNLLQAKRGGVVKLGASKYNIERPIILSTNSIGLVGDIASNQQDPDGLAPSPFGCNILVNGTRTVGIIQDAVRNGWICIREVGISGNKPNNFRYTYTEGAKGASVDLDTYFNIGIHIRGTIDQCTFEQLAINNIGCAIRGTDNQDTCVYRHINADGCGYGIALDWCYFTKIQDCVLSDLYYAAVVLGNSTNRGNSITNNTFVRCGGAGDDPIAAQMNLGPTAGTGGTQLLAIIHMMNNSSGVPGFGSFISHNNIENAGECWLDPSRTLYQNASPFITPHVNGVALYGSAISLTENSIVKCSGSGVYCDASASIIANNQICNNTESGVVVTAAAGYVTINSNTIRSNVTGVVMNSYVSRITNNMFRDNTTAIYITPSSSGFCSIIGNTFVNCTASAIIINPTPGPPAGSQIVIEGNTFASNSSYAIDVQSGSNIVVGPNVYSANNGAGTLVDVRFGASVTNCLLYLVRGMKYEIASGAGVKIVDVGAPASAGTSTAL